jgi:uncharacterized protein
LPVYLDTSVLVSAFVEDDHSDRAAAFLVRNVDVVVSRWARAEFSSAVALRSRASNLSDQERRAIEMTFDDWAELQAGCPMDEADVSRCRRLIRDGARLRTPDALHLALVLRHGLRLATFDRDLALAAEVQGVEVVVP